MPVLSNTVANLLDLSTPSTYLFISAVLILYISIIISRKYPTTTLITILLKFPPGSHTTNTGNELRDEIFVPKG